MQHRSWGAACLHHLLRVYVRGWTLPDELMCMKSVSPLIKKASAVRMQIMSPSSLIHPFVTLAKIPEWLGSKGEAEGEERAPLHANPVNSISVWYFCLSLSLFIYSLCRGSHGSASLCLFVNTEKEHYLSCKVKCVNIRKSQTPTNPSCSPFAI